MKKIIGIICFGMLLVNMHAQTGAAASFSLKQAVDYALQNQVNIKNAVLDEAIAQQKVKEIRGMGLPQINSSFDVKDFLEIPTSLVPAEFFGGAPGSFAAVQFGTQYQASAGIDASQLIFSGDYFLGLKASKVFLELSQRSTERTKTEATVAVSKAYYTVLINQERLKLMEANLARIKKTMDDVKVMFDNGIVEKLDYDRITVVYNNLTVENEKIQRLVNLSSYLLKYQMGLDVNASITLTDKLDDVKFDPVSNNVSVEKFDYTKRVEYNLFQSQYDLARFDVRRNKYSYLPNAFAYSSVSGNAFRNDFDIFDTDKPWYPIVLIGATVKMPIFSSGQRHFKLQQAKLSLHKAENNIDFIKKSIDLELSSSIAMLQNASVSLEIQKKNIQLAEDVYKTAKIKYDQGVGSNLEMLTAETALKEAQTNYYNALYDALIAKIDFDKANGTVNK